MRSIARSMGLTKSLSKPVTTAAADCPPPPAGELRVPVRSHNGELVRFVDQAHAEKVIGQSLGEWVGEGRGQYVRMSADAPTLSSQWRGGMKTTVRSKNTLGGWLGDSAATQWHRDVPDDVWQRR